MAASTLPAVPAAPFDALAETYDEVFTNSLIGRAQRDAVWKELDRRFHPGQRILELNCGTGADAVHLADRGVEVMACDVSPRMIAVARQRLTAARPTAPPHFRVLATEEISQLEPDAPFDGAFSNFAGLNCVEDLRGAAVELARLVRPEGRVLLCMAGRTVAWEIIWYLAQGNPLKAMRRFRRHRVEARLAEGVTVAVHYPSARTMTQVFAPEFELRSSKGIGVTVPPSYLEHLARRWPRVLTALVQADQYICRLPLARSAADHVLFEFERVRW